MSHVNGRMYALPCFIGNGFDPLDNLFVILLGDVRSVDLDDPVAFSESGDFGRTSGVDDSDELSGLDLLRVQVEAVAVEVVPFDHVTKPGSGGAFRNVQLTCHFAELMGLSI